jgi:hypothetical protein
MFRRYSVKLWKVLLILLTLQWPLYAQCHVGALPWIPKSHASGRARDSVVPEDVDNPNAPNPMILILGLRPVPSALAGSRNAEDKLNSDSLGTLAGQGHDSLVSQLTSSECASDEWLTQADKNTGREAKSSSVVPVRSDNRVDLARDVYYRNRLEFAFDGGYLPINIPFVFDVFLGDAYNETPLKYTLVPLVASLRWHITDVGGPSILRGNWDMTASGSITVIPRGPETHYFSYDMGIRRNFVPRRGKIAPYFDGRLGLGEINAKEPLGVLFAQGQNFTFTVNMGSGVRYNFNSRYSASAGLNWMHISNLYLSEPAFANYGINVYGPLFGIDVRLGKPHHSSQ